MLYSRLMPLRRDYSSRKKATLGCETHSVQGFWHLGSHGSPQSHRLQALLKRFWLNHPPFSEPRVTGCGGHCAHWPFKRVCVFLADSASLWWTGILLPFTAGCFVDAFPRHWSSLLGSPAWGLGLAPLRMNLPQQRSPSGTSVLAPGT